MAEKKKKATTAKKTSDTKKTTAKKATKVTKATASKATSAMDSDDLAEGKTLLTKEGLKKLVEELDHLKTVKRKEVSERIKEAISYGDLSENSEYQEAKEEQAFVEGKIVELEEKVKNAEVIKSSKVKVAVVQLGANVKLKDMDKNETVSYQIVGSTEADPMNGLISNESPLGKAIMEKQVGDEVEFIAPKGSVNYKILDLSY